MLSLYDLYFNPRTEFIPKSVLDRTEIELFPSRGEVGLMCSLTLLRPLAAPAVLSNGLRFIYEDFDLYFLAVFAIYLRGFLSICMLLDRLGLDGERGL